jgi:hypothetical protein
MEMLSEIIWYASWPIMLYISVKFVQLNLKHYEKMERLEKYDALYAEGKLGK